MAAGSLVNVDAVNFRVAQMSQYPAQLAVWNAELYTWQSALTAAQIAALPAGPTGATFSSTDGSNVKGFSTELNLLMQVRAGTMYVPASGSPTNGVGYNFTSFFNLVVGLGV